MEISVPQRSVKIVVTAILFILYSSSPEMKKLVYRFTFGFPFRNAPIPLAPRPLGEGWGEDEYESRYQIIGNYLTAAHPGSYGHSLNLDVMPSYVTQQIRTLSHQLWRDIILIPAIFALLGLPFVG